MRHLASNLLLVSLLILATKFTGAEATKAEDNNNKDFVQSILDGTWDALVVSAQNLFLSSKCAFSPYDRVCDPLNDNRDRPRAVSASDVRATMDNWQRRNVRLVLYAPIVDENDDENDDDEKDTEDKNNNEFRESLLVGDAEDVDDITTALSPNLPLVILAHGWGDYIGFLNGSLRDLRSRQIQIMLIDWSLLAPLTSYLESAHNAIRVGDYVGAVLARLIQNRKIRPPQVYLVGQSMGAHLAGEIGRNVYAWSGMKLGRITGLDPAGPYFESVLHSSLLLDRNDAVLVDVVHTNGGEFGAGLSGDAGHVDFYVNGGNKQPGCDDFCEELGALCARGINLFLQMSTCSHWRAVNYFGESISNPSGFKARLCSSYDAFVNGHCDNNTSVNMGFDLNRRVESGRYYLNVAPQAPHALG